MWLFSQAKNIVIGFCCKKLHEEKFGVFWQIKGIFFWNAQIQQALAQGILLVIFWVISACVSHLIAL